MRIVLWSVVVVVALAGCIDEPDPWLGKDIVDVTADVGRGEGIRRGDGRLGDQLGNADIKDTSSPDVHDTMAETVLVDLPVEIKVADVVDAADLPMFDHVDDAVPDVVDLMPGDDGDTGDTCEPQCEGKDCGADGCGGNCGECGPGQVCVNGLCPPEGKTCDDANDVDWDGCTSEGIIAEFHVNTTTTGDQWLPRVAAAADGTYVIVWESDGQDDDGRGAVGRRCESQLGTCGPEFVVNTNTTGDQRVPHVAPLSNGGWIIVWHGKELGGANTDVFGQRYLSDGTASGGEFQINTHPEYSQGDPVVSGFPSGGFMVAWRSYDQDGDGYCIVARRFLADGSPEGDEFIVNSTIIGDQKWPYIATALDGRALVVWNSVEQDGDGNGVFAQFYDSLGGNDGGEIQVNAFTTGNQNAGSPASLSDGGFAVAWNGVGSEDNDGGVFARVYSPDSAAKYDPFLVNSHTANGQGYVSVAGDQNGGFAVVWQSSKQDGDGFGVFARLFGSDGLSTTGEIQANGYVVGDQGKPYVAAFSDGTFVVVWESSAQDGDGYGIFAQRFDKDGNKLYK